MEYKNVVQGIFWERPNRFIAICEIGGVREVCHVKNTGRCRELLVPGATVYLQYADDPSRKTQYDLIAVEKGDRLINMDSQAPNRAFGEWVKSGKFLPDLLSVRPEFTWEDSRFDFRLEDSEGPIFVEVKGVTLEENGLASFPDAPTERGIKHLQGLQRVVEQGGRAAVVFVIQMKGIRSFSPNDRTHPAFGETLRRVAAAGVQVYAYDCLVTPETMTLDCPVEICL